MRKPDGAPRCKMQRGEILTEKTEKVDSPRNLVSRLRKSNDRIGLNGHETKALAAR